MLDKQKITDLANERIAEINNGSYLVSVEILPGNFIQVELDNEHRGVSVEDCISVSRNIEHNLDREEEDFKLEVSSPGLSNPLKVWKQYKKNIGRELDLKVDENKKRTGKLISADENGIEMEFTSKERVEGKKKKIKILTTEKFNYNEIIEAKIVIAFK